MDKATANASLSKKLRNALSREAIYVARFICFLRGLPEGERVPKEDFLGFTTMRTQSDADAAVAKMMTRLDGFLVGLVEANEATSTNTLTPNTLQQTKDKILSFARSYATVWARRDTRGKVTSPFLTVQADTPSFKAAIRHHSASVTTLKIKRTDVDKASDHGTTFSPTTVKDLVRSVMAMGLSATHADVMAASMCLYSTLCRGDEINSAKLCDLRMDATGRDAAPVFSFMIREVSKSSRKGKPQYYGMLRHASSPSLCAVFWLGYYLFTQRFAPVDRPYPDLRTRESWYDRPMFVARGAQEATLDRVQSLRTRAAALLKLLGVTFVDHQIFHAFRKLGVLNLELSRVEEDHAKRHGHWHSGKDIKSEHYHPKFAHFALAAQAGILDVTTQDYECPRDRVFASTKLDAQLDQVMADLAETGEYEVLRCFRWESILADDNHPYWAAELADTTRHAARNFNGFACHIAKVFVSDLAFMPESERRNLQGIDTLLKMESFQQFSRDIVDNAKLFELSDLSEASSMRTKRAAVAGTPAADLIRSLESKVDEQSKTISELTLKVDHLLSLVKLLHVGVPTRGAVDSDSEGRVCDSPRPSVSNTIIPETPPTPSGRDDFGSMPLVPTLRQVASWEQVVSWDLQGVMDAGVSSNSKEAKKVKQRQAELRKCRKTIMKAANSEDRKAMLRKAKQLDSARLEGGMTLAQHLQALSMVSV